VEYLYLDLICCLGQSIFEDVPDPDCWQLITPNSKRFTFTSFIWGFVSWLGFVSCGTFVCYVHTYIFIWLFLCIYQATLLFSLHCRFFFALAIFRLFIFLSMRAIFGLSALTYNNNYNKNNNNINLIVDFARCDGVNVTFMSF